MICCRRLKSNGLAAGWAAFSDGCSVGAGRSAFTGCGLVSVNAGAGAGTGAGGCGLASGTGCGACAASVCGACTAGRVSVNGADETMLIGTEEPTGFGRRLGTNSTSAITAACSSTAATKAGARLWVWRGVPIASPLTAPAPLARRPRAVSRPVSAPDDGPPVSVIRLMLVKPEAESAAITWATVA